MVKTESSSKDLFDCSVNRFFVKGQESIYYTYNNGKLASDPKLACENFLGALERIPKVIESHEKEMEKVAANKEIYATIASGSWKKEDELRSLKSEAAELDRKIALTLAPPEEENETEEEQQEQEHGVSEKEPTQETRHSAESIFNRQTEEIHSSERVAQTPQDNRDIMSRVVISKPKWR